MSKTSKQVTTIQVDKTTHDAMAELCPKTQSYGEFVAELLKFKYSEELAKRK